MYVGSDYVSRDVLLRWTYFASLALFNGRLVILRIPLDTIFFKVNFKVKDFVKVASHKLVNRYHEFTISFAKGVGMAK